MDLSFSASALANPPHGFIPADVMRNRRSLLALTVALALPVFAPAANSPVLLPEGTELRTFEGEPGAIRLFSEDTGISAMVTPSFGGRILFYGIEGENLLWLPTRRGAGGALESGGYQLDLGPESRGFPPRPTLSSGQYRSNFPRDFTVDVHSLPDPLLGVRLGKEVVIDPESGDLGLSQTITNVSPREVSFCHRDRTLLHPHGYLIIPVNKKSRFKNDWAVRQDGPTGFVYAEDTPESEDLEVRRGMLFAKAAHPPMQIGLDSDAGWVAYAWRHYLYVKYFPHYETGNYSESGCTVTASWNDRFLELNVLSPEIKLKPGESYRFPEFWKIVELKDDVASMKEARKAAKEVPRSPFGK